VKISSEMPHISTQVDLVEQGGYMQARTSFVDLYTGMDG